MIARKCFVSGRVQGVFYRASMVREATRLGVHGWVRNRADGSVEALARGTPEGVQALTDWARRGPERARVDEVRVVELATDEALAGFEARPTV